MRAYLSNELILKGFEFGPKQTKIEICDTNPDTIGLNLVLPKSNPKSGRFNVRYKRDGKTTRYHIPGKYPDVTIEQARAIAKEVLSGIRMGIYPDAKSPVQQDSMPTLQQAFSDIYIPLKKAQGKRSLDDDLAVFRLRIQPTPLASKKACDVTKAELSALHQQIRASGLAASTANHPIRLCKAIYNVLIDSDIGITLNPARGISLFAERKIEHYLNETELQTLWQTLEESSAPSRFVFMFLLCTGARLNEALKAQWHHIDTDKRIWRIPAETSKSKRVRAIPLNDPAIEILEQVGTKGKYSAVFTNPKTQEPFRQIHGPWKKIRETAGLPHLRIHDLRHEFASLLVNSGRSLYETQIILGHSDPKVTMRYASLSTKTMQDAANCAGDLINKAANNQ